MATIYNMYIYCTPCYVDATSGVPNLTMDEIKHTTASIWSLTSLLVDDCEQVLHDLDQVKYVLQSDDTLVASPGATSTPAQRQTLKRKGDVFASPVHRPVSKIRKPR